MGDSVAHCYRCTTVHEHAGNIIYKLYNTSHILLGIYAYNIHVMTDGNKLLRSDRGFKKTVSKSSFSILFLVSSTEILFIFLFQRVEYCSLLYFIYRYGMLSSKFCHDSDLKSIFS